MRVRTAVSADVTAMSSMLLELVAANKRTRPSDPGFVRDHYVDGAGILRCVIAEDESGTVLGFQCLKIADEDNSYGTPVGWGYIGTHVSPRALRRGVGRRLFAATRHVARDARLPAIEAFIGADNVEGQAYYDAMGFRTYRTPPGAVCKRFDVG